MLVGFSEMKCFNWQLVTMIQRGDEIMLHDMTSLILIGALIFLYWCMEDYFSPPELYEKSYSTHPSPTLRKFFLGMVIFGVADIASWFVVLYPLAVLAQKMVNPG